MDMSTIQKQSRSQIQMLSIDSLIAKDHAIRLIDQFVESIDDKGLGFVIKGKSNEGRPAFDIKSMIKLYIYGYINGVRSSRRLSKECKRNLELWWLLGELKPKFVTISNFRKENKDAFRALFRAFNMICQDAGLISKSVVAIDGSKFRAVNSKKNNYNAKKIQQHLEYIDKQTEAFMEAFDDNDKREKKEKLTGKKVEESLKNLKERRVKYDKLNEQLQCSDQTQISTVDPDARALPLHMNIVEVGYNVQTAVEQDNKLIVEYEVTNELDIYALSGMAIKAKAALQLEEGELTVLADKGYYTGIEIQKCHEAGIETIVSAKKHANDNKAERYQKRNFTYDVEKNAYICPEGKELTTNNSWYQKGGKGRASYKVQHYKLHHQICDACPFKEECVGGRLKYGHGKVIERSEYEANLERNNEKMASNINLYKKRQAIVEHPFGTIKRQRHMTHTLLKGKEKVSGEFGLIFLAYNFTRIMTMIKNNALKINNIYQISSILSIQVIIARHNTKLVKIKI